MSTKHGSISLQAIRRLQGGELLENGYDLDEVVEMTGASLSSVKRWRKKINEGGISALARQQNSGRKSNLTPEQFDELKQIVKTGAVAAGFSNERWNSQRVAKVIADRFGVEYCVKYIPELLHKLGLSQQIPNTQSPKRSQAAIDHWRRYVWPRVKKKSATTVTS
jgi:transposase